MKRLFFVVLICATAQFGPFSFPSLDAAPKLTRAQQRKSRTLKRRMYKLFGQKKYRQVVVVTLELYNLVKDPQLLANIGYCYEQLNRHKKALSFYQKFVRLSPPNHKTLPRVRKQINAIKRKLMANKREVNILSQPGGATVRVDGKRVGKTPAVVFMDLGRHVIELTLPGFRKLRRAIRIVRGPALSLDYPLKRIGRVGRLTVRSNVDGAMIYLNNALIGRAPLKRHQLAAGRYKIRVTAPGYRALQETISIDANKVTVLRAQLVKLVKQVVDSGEREKLGKRLWIGGWITFGLSAGLIAGGLAMQLISRNKAIDLNDKNTTFLNNNAGASQTAQLAFRDSINWDSEWDTVTKLSKGAIAMFVIGGAGMVASIVMLSLSPSYRSKEKQTSLNWKVIPVFGPGQVGIQSQIRF